MADRLPALFCDGIIEANVLNGVVRIQLGQTGGDGKPVPVGQLILPLAQLPSAANAMVNLVRQVQEKMKEASEKAQAAGAAAPVAAEVPQTLSEVPSAFKFS